MEVALRILLGENGGVWHSIGDIQRGRGGLVLTKPRNNEGVLCSSSTECMRQWWGYFDHVLNSPSHFLVATIKLFPSYDVHDHMANVPAILKLHCFVSRCSE